MKKDDRFLRLYKTLEPYIAAASRSFSQHFYHLTFEDLKQEVAIRLLILLRMEEYKLNDVDLLQLLKTTVYNVLRSMYRTEMRERMDRIVGDIPHSSAEDEVQSQAYIKTIRATFDTNMERAIFDLMLNPTKELVKMAQDHQRKAEKQHERSVSFASKEVVIYTQHIAQVLGVSRATVSRAFAAVRSKIEEADNP